MSLSNSIATWQVATHEGDPCFDISYPSSSEVAWIVQWLESSIVSRNGYNITIDGSCSKGPQGINWNVRVVFEAWPDSDLFAAMLTEQLGEPTRVSVSQTRPRLI